MRRSSSLSTGQLIAPGMWSSAYSAGVRTSISTLNDGRSSTVVGLWLNGVPPGVF